VVNKIKKRTIVNRNRTLLSDALGLRGIIFWNFRQSTKEKCNIL
jgi:hypothetical protein